MFLLRYLINFFLKDTKNSRIEMKTLKKKFSIMTAKDCDFKMLSTSIGNSHYSKS